MALAFLPTQTRFILSWKNKRNGEGAANPSPERNTMGIIKKKNRKQSEIFKDLCTIYNFKGSLAAWNWSSTLTKEGCITSYEANAIMKEVMILFEDGE